MGYKLEHLERLVMDTARGNPEERFSLSEADQRRILNEALEETEKIKILLVQEVFRFTKEKEIEVYIKNYQIALTHLLDRLYGQERQSKDPGEEVHRFYQGFSHAILALLSFIEERFSKYFDKGEKVPDVYLALVRHEVQQKLVALSAILQAKTADELIAGQIFQKLGAFVALPTATTLAYREIMFYKELVKELEDLTHWEKGSGMYSGLQQLLIYLNFNDKEFINEMVNRMVAELRGMEDLNEKIDRLLLYSKAINQLQLKPDSGLNARHPSVKNQLAAGLPKNSFIWKGNWRGSRPLLQLRCLIQKISKTKSCAICQ